MAMFTLSPETVLRPEPGGALIFQRETAETALLDMEGLETLYLLLKGQLRDYPVFFVGYLQEERFIIPGPPDGAVEQVEECLELAKTIQAPPRSLSAPETIHFAVTGRCDQSCEGCFYSARPGSNVEAADAPFAIFEKVVDEAARVKVFQMALGGGEPLLHPRIVDMVRLARGRGIVPNITTNGNLLDREMALALKEAGVGQIQISLNGASEEANAATRPNFRKAIRALETCRELGIRFGINFLLTRSNADELKPVVELGRRLGAVSVNILRPKPPTTGGDWLERESLGSEDYRRLKSSLPKLVKLAGETKLTLDASLTFLLTDRTPKQLYRAGAWGCTAARRFLTIAQDGKVFPCSHVRWSDVGNGDFMRAWWGSEVFSRFRAQEETLRGRCRACPYLEVCKGCRAVVMAFGGDFADSDPHCPQ
ncbi:MAG: hypothetical protein DRI61_07520 [Chloroflexi bacterium]|nr:MAG: hypothetical protein DRI61_07520 [Chloroflexota bacterium]